MKKVLVSGASGFIGRNLVSKLLEEGIEVVSIGRTDPGFDSVRHMNFDFSEKSFDSITVFLKNEKFDTFYHTAWIGVNGADKKDLTIQAKNMNSALTSVLIAHSVGAKLITLGSASEFSASGKEIIDDMKPAPLDIYGLSKAFIREHEKNLSDIYGVPLIQTVVGSIYGPGRGIGDALSFALNKLIAGESPRLDSNGEQTWEYLYIDDLIEALYLIGVKGESDSNYVISSGERKALSEFLNIAKIFVKNSDKLEIDFGNQFGGNLEMDNSLLKKHTGWENRTSFEKGSEKLVKYLEKASKEKKNK